MALLQLQNIASSKFALSGILFCGECWKPYQRRTWAKNGKKKVVWRCSNCLINGTKYCKKSPTVEEAALQKAVLQAIKDHYGVDRIISKPALSSAAPHLHFEEQVEQLRQSVPILLFLAAAGEQIGYEQQMKFVETRIQDLKNCQPGGAAEAPVVAADEITCHNITNWDEMEIRKLVKEATILSGDEVSVKFPDDAEIIVTMV